MHSEQEDHGNRFLKNYIKLILHRYAVKIQRVKTLRRLFGSVINDFLQLNFMDIDPGISRSLFTIL